MININEVIETNKMIDKENLDVRTITLGISLLDCIDSDLNKLCDNVYKKITTMAKDLVATGEEIGKEFGSGETESINVLLRNAGNSEAYYQYEKITDQNIIDKYKEIFDIKKLNAEFSKQTFKEIMIATQDNNNRIKNIDKEQ